MLTLASTPSAVADVRPVDVFVRRVAAVSHGALRIRVIDQWGAYAPDAEVREVGAVAAGKLDLGWVGSRVFDVLGVRSFDALSAPMLIDSYPLEGAVLRSRIPDRMLGALERLHVTALGMLGNSLRRPISVQRPLLSPTFWRGTSFGTYRSEVQESAIHALGARPVRAFGTDRLRALDLGLIQGFEFDLYRDNRIGLWPRARYVVGNVVLWPEFDVLFANPDRFASLTAEQRGWVREAAAAAAGESVAALGEANLIRAACAGGARVANANGADLAAFRRAFAPVYRALERDPETRQYIRKIERLKRETGAPPGRLSPVPAGCRA